MQRGNSQANPGTFNRATANIKNAGGQTSASGPTKVSGASSTPDPKGLMRPPLHTGMDLGRPERAVSGGMVKKG